MASTAKTQALHRGLTSARHRVHMVVLQELARLAAPPRVADERALPPIPLPHRALHVRRDVARVAGRPARADPRPRGRRELLPLELGDQHVERAVDHLRDVPGGELVTQQRLGVPQLLVRGLLDRDLEREALRRKRRHPASRHRCRHLRRRKSVDRCPRGQLLRGGAEQRWRRNGFEPSRDVRLREPPRQQLLDLRLGLVRGGGHELGRVGRGQVGSQQHHRAEMQPAVGDRAEDHGEPPSGARRPNVLHGGLLAQVQLPDAVRVHRGEPGRQVEPACVNLGKVGQYRRQVDAPSRKQHIQIAGSGGVTEASQVVGAHDLFLLRGRTVRSGQVLDPAR